MIFHHSRANRMAEWTQSSVGVRRYEKINGSALEERDRMVKEKKRKEIIPARRGCWSLLLVELTESDKTPTCPITRLLVCHSRLATEGGSFFLLLPNTYTYIYTSISFSYPFSISVPLLLLFLPQTLGANDIHTVAFDPKQNTRVRRTTATRPCERGSRQSGKRRRKGPFDARHRVLHKQTISRKNKEYKKRGTRARIVTCGSLIGNTCDVFCPQSLRRVIVKRLHAHELTFGLKSHEDFSRIKKKMYSQSVTMQTVQLPSTEYFFTSFTRDKSSS